NDPASTHQRQCEPPTPAQHQERATVAAAGQGGQGRAPMARPRVAAAGQPRIGGESGQGEGEHGGGEVGDGKPARRGVPNTHGQGSQRDQRIQARDGRERATIIARGPERGREEQARLDYRYAEQPALPRVVQPRTEAAADDGADEKGGQRSEGAARRELGHAGEREPQEDDVAGHVGGKYAPQSHDADGVDQSCGDRQHHEERGERAGLHGIIRRITTGNPRWLLHADRRASRAKWRKYSRSVRAAPGATSSSKKSRQNSSRARRI